jgi:transcriptional antiterminator
MAHTPETIVKQAYEAYTEAQQQRLNIPVEMALFAIRSGKVAECRTYLLTHFLFSGKALISDRPLRTIAEHLNITERTVYRHFEWLLSQNWIGKDERKGWYFFRGIDRIRDIEGWKAKRSSPLTIENLQELRGFFCASTIASIQKTRNKTARTQKGRALPAYTELSLKTIQSVFNVSRSTAQNHIKRAKRQRLLSVVTNLKHIRINQKDLRLLRAYGEGLYTFKLFGSTDTIEAKPEQLRSHYGQVFVQLPNLMKSGLAVCNRSH